MQNTGLSSKEDFLSSVSALIYLLENVKMLNYQVLPLSTSSVGLLHSTKEIIVSMSTCHHKRHALNFPHDRHLTDNVDYIPKIQGMISTYKILTVKSFSM